MFAIRPPAKGRFFAASAVAVATLAAGLTAPAIAQQAAPETYSVDDREAFRAEVRAFLLEEPDLILEVMRILEAERRAAEQAEQERIEREAQALLSDRSDDVFDDGFSFVGGNPDGDVTLVEFIDYNCGFCKRAHGEVARFLETDGRVRLVVKEFPILSQGSVYAGRAALASMKQADGALYKPLHEGMITYQGQLTEDVVLSIAEEVGLDVAQLETDMASEEVTARIERTYALADALGIRGTPAFIIGDEIVRGFVPTGALVELAEAAREADQ